MPDSGAHSIVIAYHIVLGFYGCWLPNDPRGSTSRQIKVPWIEDLGQLHYGRRIIQPSHQVIRDFYENAAGKLLHAIVDLHREETLLAADAIGEAISERNYTCYGLAVMRDHVHVCLRRHRETYEKMFDVLKAPVTHTLRRKWSRPEHPVWAAGGWAVFLDEPADVLRTVDYIKKNHKDNQRWPFVSTYDNWPFHEGHSMNSPYVRRLREIGRWPPRFG